MDSKRLHLEPKGADTTLSRFLQEGLVKLEDNGNTEQNTSTRSNGSHEISHDGQCSDAHASKGGRRRNVAVEDMNQGRITVSLHDHLVVAELLSNITSRRSRDFNPGLGKESARRQNERQVKDGMERVVDNFSKRLGRRNVVPVVSWESQSVA